LRSKTFPPKIAKNAINHHYKNTFINYKTAKNFLLNSGHYTIIGKFIQHKTVNKINIGYY